MKSDKATFWLLAIFWILTVLTYQSCSPLPDSRKGKIRIASFNIERFGDYDKDENTLVSILTNFDLVGILEVMHPVGVSNLANALQRAGQNWHFLISSTWQGTPFYHEYVAYLWNPARITLTQDLHFYPDPDNLFTRAPYGASFRGEYIDFTFVIVHLIYGGTSSNDIARRKSEVQALPSALTYFDIQYNDDSDILLGGDFNLSADDSSFSSLFTAFYTNTLPANALTTITYAGPHSAYDNFFYNILTTPEYNGVSRVFDFTDGNYAYATRNVSDHLPIFLELNDLWDDD